MNNQCLEILKKHGFIKNGTIDVDMLDMVLSNSTLDKICEFCNKNICNMDYREYFCIICRNKCYISDFCSNDPYVLYANCESCTNNNMTCMKCFEEYMRNCTYCNKVFIRCVKCEPINTTFVCGVCKKDS